jgi:hypothetical protein
MRSMGGVGLVAIALGLLATPAGAQEVAPGTALSFTGGFTSASETTGIALGGAILFDLTDRVSVEGEGAYFDRGSGASGVSLNGSLLVNFVPGRRQVVPYAAAGVGLYRASFELGNRAMLGSVSGQYGPGSEFCPAPGTGMMGHGPGPGFGGCPPGAAGYWGVGQMPHFYGRRLGILTMPASGRWGARTFTDPAVSIGGGVRFNISERLMVRPDLRALVIFGNGDTNTLAVFGVNVGYRF